MLAGTSHYLGSYASEQEAGEVVREFRHAHGRTTHDLGKSRACTTREIRATLKTNKGKGSSNHAVPVTLPLAYPHRALPVDPYVLGVWLGDGHSAGSRITSADAEIRAEAEAAGYPTTDHKVPEGKCQAF